MAGIAHPFGSHTFQYAAGSILPTGDRATLDNWTSDFYTKWKAIYVDQKTCSEGTVIDFHHFNHARATTVSEGMGYGMVIAVMMAGCDADAHTIYDSMVAFVKAHTNANGLLSWEQVASGTTCPNGAPDSATDGDLDVAFSYILADKQWGSGGAVNYLAEAQHILAAIKQFDLDATSYVTNLGDADVGSGNTRPSDWMIDHFRAFAKIDPVWMQTIDNTYTIADHIQTKYSTTTGLIPDYVINVDSADPAPTAAGTQVQESNYTDSEVAYNSCRVPWHLGTDFLASGDPRAKKAVDRITQWIKTSVGGDPSKIIDGYKLDGSPGSLDPAGWPAGVTPTHSVSLAFDAPFAVGAMTDPANQVWLDALWNFVTVQHADVFQDDDYYGNTIKVLNLIIMSGNWWAP
jgi:endo-1,4-beta-D-glucanase Y